MLPEEQLFRTLRQKQAGIFDLYKQQSNLGGDTFTKDEDPLTSLLGQEFNNQYRGEYADTLQNGWLTGKNRLTSRTGARLLNDLNEMTPRGLSALRGLAANPEKSLKFMRSINDSRIGVNGYTKENAEADYNSLAEKINMAARLHGTGDRKLFDEVANKYVKGQFGETIEALKGAIKGAPGYTKGFITDFSNEFSKAKSMQKEIMKAAPKGRASGVKVQSTTATGKVDESTFSAKNDKEETGSGTGNILESIMGGAGSAFGKIGDFFKGDGRYILPMLLLGAAGGGINKARGGSFLQPLLIAALLGGLYSYGRKNNMVGSPTNAVNSFIDKATNTTMNLPGTLYNSFNSAKASVAPTIKNVKNKVTNALYPVVNKVTNTITPMVSKTKGFFTGKQATKYSSYHYTSVDDFLD